MKLHPSPAVQSLFDRRTKQGRTNLLLLLLTAVALVPAVQASTTGAEFAPAYQFIYDAATGYLGRGIAITGGVIGLGVGAATGKALPAVVGICLGVFGSLGPSIVDSIFNTAIV